MARDTYVLVHGAWHTGELLEPVAQHLRARGHTVYCPTLAGNRPGDNRSKSGLAEAARSLVEFVGSHGLADIRLVGHSYGGMVISQAITLLGERVKRLVYWSALVPLNGQCLADLIPGEYRAMFDEMAAANDGAITVPYPVWREIFMNDADAELAERAYAQLNPHPYKTFTDPVQLTCELAQMPVGKSFLHCRQDTALPHSLGWHPRLSERLGLFRLIECDGGHEMCFTDPELLAQKIEEAGRD